MMGPPILRPPPEVWFRDRRLPGVINVEVLLTQHEYFLDRPSESEARITRITERIVEDDINHACDEARSIRHSHAHDHDRMEVYEVYVDGIAISYGDRWSYVCRERDRFVAWLDMAERRNPSTSPCRSCGRPYCWIGRRRGGER